MPFENIHSMVTSFNEKYICILHIQNNFIDHIFLIDKYVSNINIFYIIQILNESLIYYMFLENFFYFQFNFLFSNEKNWKFFLKNFAKEKNLSSEFFFFNSSSTIHSVIKENSLFIKFTKTIISTHFSFHHNGSLFSYVIVYNN